VGFDQHNELLEVAPDSDSARVHQLSERFGKRDHGVTYVRELKVTLKSVKRSEVNADLLPCGPASRGPYDCARVVRIIADA
jgi:hypothetical protein